MLKQFSKFATVGAVGTLVHYVVLILMVSGLALSPILGTSTGALAGALVNYVLNHHYTFGGGASHARALPRFMLMAAVGLGLNATIVGMLTHFGIHYLVAQVLATGIVLVVNYLVSKLWIFHSKKTPIRR